MAEARTEMMPMPAIALRTKTNAMPSKTAMMRGSSEYYSLRATVLDVGKAFLEPQCRVLDLNCADGCWSEPLVQHFGFFKGSSPSHLTRMMSTLAWTGSVCRCA